MAGQCNGSARERERLERVTLGSFARKLEWGGARARKHHTRTGMATFLDTGKTRLGGFGKY